jgi:hypothetical protein
VHGSPRGKLEGYDTSKDTMQGKNNEPPRQANMVELVGIEPTTSSLRILKPALEEVKPNGHK